MAFRAKNHLGRFLAAFCIFLQFLLRKNTNFGHWRPPNDFWGAFGAITKILRAFYFFYGLLQFLAFFNPPKGKCCSLSTPKWLYFFWGGGIWNTHKRLSFVEASLVLPLKKCKFCQFWSCNYWGHLGQNGSLLPATLKNKLRLWISMCCKPDIFVTQLLADMYLNVAMM